MIARDCGGPVCWCGSTVHTYSTKQGEHLNARPAEASHMIPLVETLRLAVPLHVVEVLAQSLTANQMHARLSKAATAVGSYGDLLLYGGKTAKSRQHTAEAFNALAYGLAVCSMQPGGIHYGGVHWEVAPATVPEAAPRIPAPRPDQIPEGSRT
jgi:hypothetical protein